VVKVGEIDAAVPFEAVQSRLIASGFSTLTKVTGWPTAAVDGPAIATEGPVGVEVGAGVGDETSVLSAVGVG
jgi:hypothetical protein